MDKEPENAFELKNRLKLELENYQQERNSNYEYRDYIHIINEKNDLDEIRIHLRTGSEILLRRLKDREPQAAESFLKGLEILKQLRTKYEQELEAAIERKKQAEEKKRQELEAAIERKKQSEEKKRKEEEESQIWEMKMWFRRVCVMGIASGILFFIFLIGLDASVGDALLLALFFGIPLGIVGILVLTFFGFFG